MSRCGTDNFEYSLILDAFPAQTLDQPVARTLGCHAYALDVFIHEDVKREPTRLVMQPFIKIFKAIIAGQIDLQRCNGNKIVFDGVKIGTLSGILGSTGRPDPVHRVAARVRLPNHTLGLVAIAESRQ